MKVEGNLALKEEPLEEIIGGKVVMMSPPAPNHGRVTSNLDRIFNNYLLDKQCEYFADSIGLILSKRDKFIPDGMIVCDRSQVKDDGVHGAPSLTVEVLSPSTARYDRGRKKDIYERLGVREYWIVSPSDMTIEQYLLQDGKFVLNDVYRKYREYELEDMKEEERAAIVTEFRCSLFDDLIIRVDDVFRRLEWPG